MKVKTFLAILILAIALLSTSFITAASANRGQTMKMDVDYCMNAVLNNPVVTVIVNNGILTVDGYRPPSGIQSCILTVNGEEYSYPDDFGYTETFHLERNLQTGLGAFQVTTTFTFNLPGNPTITEWISGELVKVGSRTDFDGAFYLTGTRMFTPVEGEGIVDSYQISGTDYATHTGLIKGWIFD
jgi:hypothetical protein